MYSIFIRMTSGIAVFAENLKQAERFKNVLRISKGISNTNTKPLYNYLVITAASPFTNQTVFQERVGLQLKMPTLSNAMQVKYKERHSDFDDYKASWLELINYLYSSFFSP